MIPDIDLRLQQLIALWVDGTPEGVRGIPGLCDEIAELAEAQRCALDPDPKLLQRASLLAAKAEQRLAACVEIQSRTGSYSIHGALETSPRIATTGWEG